MVWTNFRIGIDMLDHLYPQDKPFAHGRKAWVEFLVFYPWIRIIDK